MNRLTLEERRKQLGVLLRAGSISQQQYDELLRRHQQAAGAERPQERSVEGRDRHDDRRRLAPGRPRVDHSGLASAPYRFVTFPGNKIVMPESAAVADINVPKPEGFCAEIEVIWVAETPLLIGEKPNGDSKTSGDREGEVGEPDTVVPMTFAAGEQSNHFDWCIPGATLRGAIRSAAEIAGFGRLTQVNRTHSFGLRDFEHERYAAGKDARYPIADVNQLKAGWLRKHANCTTDEPLYELFPCEWFVVPADELLRERVVETRETSARDFTRLSLLDKYRAAGMARRGSNRINFQGEPRRFTAMDEINSKPALRPAASGAVSGVLVFSDRSPSGKRLEYVFTPFEGGPPLTVQGDDWKQFERIHSVAVKDKLKPTGSWATLRTTLDDASRPIIPVFYVGEPKPAAPARADRERKPFAMGLTRLFKAPHERSLGDVLDRSGATLPPRTTTGGKEAMDVDMVECLFGYVYPDQSSELASSTAPSALARKGRVAFSSARLANPDTAELTEIIETIMMGARASFAPFYLRGKFKDYSDANATIAGRKRYLPRYPAERLAGAHDDITRRLREQIEALKRTSKQERPGGDTRSYLRFLAPRSGSEMRFMSRIRLFNVTGAEIGLILWVLTHGGVTGSEPGRPPSRRLRHMIGRAKPFGAGQMRVESARLAVEPNGVASDLVRRPAPEEIVGRGTGGYCPAQCEEADSVVANGLSNASHAPFLAAFERHVKQTIDPATWKMVIGEYLKSCDPVVGAALQDKGKLDYLPLRKELGNHFANPYQLLRGMTKPRKDASAPVGKDRLLDFDVD